MINALTVKNIAAFEELHIDFSPKINVIIGENSCGKTQLLKIAYALNFTQGKIADGSLSTKVQINDFLASKFVSLFKPDKEKVGAICNKYLAAKSPSSCLLTDGNDKEFGCEISSSRSTTVSVQGDHKLGAESGVFIPTKEVLSLLPAIANRQVEAGHLKALFDDTVLDLCYRLLVKPQEDIQKAINEDPRIGTLLPDLANAIGGLYEIDGANQHFAVGEYTEKSRSTSLSRQARIYSDGTILSFTQTKAGVLSTSMTAEGYRKIGILQRLLENGELSLSTGSPLFWDEPESNMNPKLMKSLVSCLLELSRNGKQIILASHDYVLLKWFDLLVDEGKDDHILYHSLHKNSENEKIEINTTNDYLAIYPNAIDETFEFLINSELDRSLGSIGQ